MNPDAQRQATALLLSALADAGFALAGSGAIREHGLTHRPTEDIDLFTVEQDDLCFQAAADSAVEALQHGGFTVATRRRLPLFAQFELTSPDGDEISVDLGVDWRSRQPVTLAVGPVLALPDAVANKVCALYSRGEARDYLDVDSIRRSGVFTDAEMLDLAQNADPGFETEQFIAALRACARVTPDQISVYGLDPADLEQVKARLLTWADELAEASAGP